MKVRIGFVIAVCIALLFCSLSCQSEKTEPAMVPEVYCRIVSGDDVADVTLTAEYGEQAIDNGPLSAPGSYLGVKSMLIEVVNTSEESLQISWEKSTISYGGNSSKVNYIGQGKYGKKYVIPDTLIKKGKKHCFSIFPQDQLKMILPDADEGDDINPTFGVNVIPATEVDVLLCLVHPGGESKYAAHIGPKGSLE